MDWFDEPLARRVHRPDERRTLGAEHGYRHAVPGLLEDRGDERGAKKGRPRRSQEEEGVRTEVEAIFKVPTQWRRFPQA